VIGLADFGGIADRVVTAAAIFGAGWALAKWYGRPRFICGIPPSEDEQQEKRIPPELVGRPSLSHGYKHRARCFARRLCRPHKRELSPRDIRRASDPLRARALQAGRKGDILFPLLIANRGHRIALDYTVSIVIYPSRRCQTAGTDSGVHIVDVLVESFKLNLYVSDPTRVRRPEIRALISADPIRRDYGYMTDGLSVDGIYLSGTIVEAGSYELVHVDAEVESSVDSFYLLFAVSCSDGWMRDAAYLQRCVVRHADSHSNVAGSHRPEVGDGAPT
jgi:hypothetical protein